MVSRRNIRIEVVQSIFEANFQENELNKQLALKIFNEKINNTQALYAAIVHLTYLISQYVTIYANKKASKLLPTAEDKNINIKIAHNILMTKLKENTSFIDVIKKYKIANLFEEEFVKKLFILLINTDEYKQYIKNPLQNSLEEKNIIQTILNSCIFENEETANFLAEKYMNWYTDFEMLYSWNEKLLHNIKAFPFNEIISAEKMNFAKDLLNCYYDKKEIVFEIIKPKLANWDPDRIAHIDMIILHVAICEFLYFETIPVKVTINEYIDIAKEYSTQQSGVFVNGVLDNIRKELEQQNKIHKIAFEKNK